MGKGAIVVVLLVSIAAVMLVVHTTIKSSREVDEWLLKLGYAKKRVTELQVYMHDTLTGLHPTALRVANSSITYSTPSLFGLVNVIDNPLTLGHDPASTLVGRVQGFYAASGLQEFSLTMAGNFVFTSGKYNGSSLTILGQILVPDPVREVPIVGGSGFFRSTGGYAVVTTYWSNTTTKDAIVLFHFYASHYY